MTAHRTLAIDGGTPLFADPRHVGRPNIVNRDGLMRRIEGMLDSGRLANAGPLVQEFEEKLAELIGVEHVIAVCNGTIGLEIAIRALGFHGEVIVPSWTFIATAHSLQWQEIKPVFADIDPVRHTLSPQSVEAMITPNTTGIMGVHVWGRPCDADALRRIADDHGLGLLFDAAHAFNTTLGDRPVGTLGDVEVFSFHATKFLNTFEGGAIVTNDAEVARKIRLMTNFGFEDLDKVTYLGTNGKMTEVCAAQGLAQLECLDELVEINYQRFLAYERIIGGIPGLSLVVPDAYGTSNYQYVVVLVDEATAGISRDRLVEVLRAENVLARRYFWPGCHRMEPYRSYQPHAGLLLPETERVSETVMTLPTGSGMSIDDIDRLGDLLRAVVPSLAGQKRRSPTVVPALSPA